MAADRDVVVIGPPPVIGPQANNHSPLEGVVELVGVAAVAVLYRPHDPLHSRRGLREGGDRAARRLLGRRGRGGGWLAWSRRCLWRPFLYTMCCDIDLDDRRLGRICKIGSWWRSGDGSSDNHRGVWRFG